MIVFTKSNPSVGAGDASAGKLQLRISGFSRQQVVSVEEVVKAVDVLPVFHLTGLREIIYAPELLQIDPPGFHAARSWGPRKGEFSQHARTIYFLDFDTRDLFLQILYHEIGHYVFFLVLDSRLKKRWVTQVSPGSRYVTPYAGRSPQEDFAESYAAYVRDPAGLKRIPQKYAFMHDLVFTGRPGTLRALPGG